MNAQPSESRSTAFLHVGIPDGGETPHTGTPGGAGEQMSFFDGSATLTADGSAQLTEDDAPEPPGGFPGAWLAFTGDHDPGDARQRFEARYGQPPRRVFYGLGGILLCGPVPSGVLL